MKNRITIFHAVPAALFAGIVFTLVLAHGTANAQISSGPNGSSRPRVVPIAEVRPVASTKYLAAATENAKSETSLNWIFSGRTQTGWQIYEPLIASTIGTQGNGASADFAFALSNWQSFHSIEPTGVLDEPTLAALRNFWQSQRLGRSDFPGPEKLVTAPITDFYDPTRDPDLLQLERDTYTAYKRMIAAASKDLGRDISFTKDGQLAPGEKFLRIVSAFRSQEYQDKLRRESPGSGNGTLAVHSAHNTGQALDLYVGGDPVTTTDANRLIQTQTPAYKWLVKNASRFGFYPYYYEPWHWEYVGNRK
jgi:hypothetical protein